MEAIRVAVAMIHGMAQAVTCPQDPIARARRARLSTISRRVLDTTQVVRVVSATVKDTALDRQLSVSKLVRQKSFDKLTRQASKAKLAKPTMVKPPPGSPRKKLPLYRVKKGEAKKRVAEGNAAVANPLFRSASSPIMRKNGNKSEKEARKDVELVGSSNMSSTCSTRNTSSTSKLSNIQEIRRLVVSEEVSNDADNKMSFTDDDDDDDDDDTMSFATRGRSRTFAGGEATFAAPKRSASHGNQKRKKSSGRGGGRTSVGMSGATDVAEWSTRKVDAEGRSKVDAEGVRKRTHTVTRKNFVEGVYDKTPKGHARLRKLSSALSNTRTAIMLNREDSSHDEDSSHGEDDDYMSSEEEGGKNDHITETDQASRKRTNSRARRKGSSRAQPKQQCCCASSAQNWRRARRVCSAVFRIGRTVAAFPFAIVLCSLQLRLHPKYGRKLLYVLNGFVFAVPFVIVHELSTKVSEQKQRLQEQQDEGSRGSAGDALDQQSIRFDFSRQTSVCAVAYMSFVLLPVVLKISRQVHEAFSFDRVGLGSFCFRPSYGFRWNRANILTIGGIVFEWFQHSMYCMPFDFIPRLARRHFSIGTSPGEHKSGAMSYEDLVGTPFALVFWFVLGLVGFNFVMVVLRLTLVGRKQDRFGDCWQLWLVVYYINGPLFVSIVTVLSQGLVCSYERDTPPVLLFSPSTYCWQGGHNLVAVSAMGALALYLPHATLLPSGTYKGPIMITMISHSLVARFQSFIEHVNARCHVSSPLASSRHLSHASHCTHEHASIERAPTECASSLFSLSSTSFSSCSSFVHVLLILLLLRPRPSHPAPLSSTSFSSCSSFVHVLLLLIL
jgi:hypothetical protein